MFVTLVLSTLSGFGPHGGAHLGPPADLSAPFDSARPEWYFLFLFQFLHFFSGGTEVIGSQIVPGMVLGTVALMPFIAQWKFGHRFNVTFVGAVLVAIIGLMGLALFNDYATSPSINKNYEKAVAFQRRYATRHTAPSGLRNWQRFMASVRGGVATGTARREDSGGRAVRQALCDVSLVCGTRRYGPRSEIGTRRSGPCEIRHARVDAGDAHRTGVGQVLRSHEKRQVRWEGRG